MPTAADMQQIKMNVAEALTDASRSLDRSRKKIEAVVEALTMLEMAEENNKEAIEQNIRRCRIGMAEVQQLNNSIRKMNT